MGIGDSIRKAADNAMKDLGGTSEPTDDAHVPEPGDPAEEIKVHSSISEGSNAADAAEEGTGGQAGEAGPGGARGQGQGADTGTAGNIVPGRGGPGGGPGGAGPAGAAEAGTAESGAAESGEEAPEPPRDVPGPGGLPDPDPDVLRADPSEGDSDPSTGMGRG
jgi:hypothetical protein